LKVSKSRRFDGHRIDVRSAQLLPTNGAAQAYEAWAMTRAAVTPPMPYAGYLPVADAAFATPFTRVTDAGRQMLPGLSKRYWIESRTASIENPKTQESRSYLPGFLAKLNTSARAISSIYQPPSDSSRTTG
jgi:hypothetical protein